MVFIGDCHGRFQDYFHKLMDFKIKSSIQVGDMHIGYNKGQDYLFEEWTKYLGNDNKFIRGNHDDPQACKNHQNFLGDFGYLEQQQMFYISGAWSIDTYGRQQGSDWWPNQQLTDSQWIQLIDLYRKVKPKYVVSHDAPSCVYQKVADYLPIVRNKTSDKLDIVFAIHKPIQWIHGHHHKQKFYTCEGTNFVCLNELGIYENTHIKDFNNGKGQDKKDTNDYLGKR